MKTTKKHGGAREGAGRPPLCRVKQKSVNLTDEQWEKARRIGGNNAARGIRRAIDKWEDAQ